MYAKFISENQIDIAPRNKGQWSNYDQNEKLLMADGYLPLVIVEAPTVEKPTIKYRQINNQIEQFYEDIPVIPAPEQTPEEHRRQLRGRLVDGCWPIVIGRS